MSASDLKSVDSLPSLESTLTFDEVQALVYITGYVTRKDNIGTDSTHTFFITKNVVSLPNILIVDD